MKFVAKERDRDEACFVVEEDSKLRLELNEPADLQQAEKLARYLNEHVRAVHADGKATITTVRTVRS